MKLLEIKSCSQCCYVQEHGSSDFDTCELTDEEVDYLDIPDHCPLPNEIDIEKLQEKLHQIKNWINAYPLEIFPEPDLKKAARVLKENGMTLDSISASNMRHVLNGIKNIIES